MELINEYRTETIFDLKLTERELGTILVALGGWSYDKLKDSAQKDYVKVNILGSGEQHDLYNGLLTLLDVETK